MINKILRKLVTLFLRKKIWNVIIDKQTLPVSFESIKYNNKLKLDVTKQVVTDWLKKGHLGTFISTKLHKKGLEFFFSSYLLDIREGHTVMDAAGGRSNYLNAVKENFGAKELYLTDHIFKGIRQLDNGIKIVGGDISRIQLKNSSVDRIACHHAFEHFQEDKDLAFIKEAYRLLKKDGLLVIIPLFLTNDYIECWNIPTQKHFDELSTLIVDKSASIPGADADGHFARFYDNDSLISRIINPAEKFGFKCEIIECEVDGTSIPDMGFNFGSIINKPTRALRFKKVTNG